MPGCPLPNCCHCLEPRSSNVRLLFSTASIEPTFLWGEKLFFRFFGSSTQESQRVFTKSPFEHASGAQPFCINDAYREAFVAVRYAIELRLGLIVLSGESGVGKTTLGR